MRLAYISLSVCLLILSACDSGVKSNIESTPTKEGDASNNTPPEQKTASADTGSTTAITPVADASLATGEKLYTGNCAVCHNLNKENLIGPGLAGINERRPQEWLIPWIRNSQKMVASGDKYAVELFNKYNKVAMPSYDFSDDEIKSILAYIAKNEKK